MGIKRIDFGNDVEVSKGGKVKALATSPSSGWLAEVLDVKYVTSKSSDNVGIEVTYKITDDEAVDVAGTSFTGKKQWDRMWFGSGSQKINKIKLTALMGEDEVNALVIESEEDVQDLAERLRDEARGLEVAVVTEAKEDSYGGGTYDDGTQKYKTDVKFVNEVN
jgi:hypothetical protein